MNVMKPYPAFIHIAQCFPDDYIERILTKY